MAHRYLIAYDISDEKRLVKIAKLMESVGIRVQKSIFESLLEPSDLKELKILILQIIDPVTDGVKFYKLCPKCEQRVSIIGVGRHPDLLQPLLII